jgi:hypothetical protein
MRWRDVKLERKEKRRREGERAMEGKEIKVPLVGGPRASWAEEHLWTRSRSDDDDMGVASMAERRERK